MKLKIDYVSYGQVTGVDAQSKSRGYYYLHSFQ